MFRMWRKEHYWRKSLVLETMEGHISLESPKRIFSLFINFRPNTFFLTFNFMISTHGLEFDLGLYAHMQIYILFFIPEQRYNGEYDY